MHRSEFEAAIRPQVEDTVDALQRAVSSAGLTPPQLTAVLLVGGSSRIPLVGQLVSELLGRPVSVDVDPKNAIPMGAVLSLMPAPPQVPAPRTSASAPHPARAAVAGMAPPLGGPPRRPPNQPYGPSATGTYGPGGGVSASLPPYRPAPQRPPAPPPRPSAPAYAPEYDDEPGYSPDYDYAPDRGRRTPAWLVTAGAVAAATAVVAAVFLWPRPDVEPTAGTPAPPTPAQEATEPAPTTTEEPPPPPPRTRLPQPAPQPPPVPRPTVDPTTPPVTTTTTTTPPTTTPAPTTPPEDPGGDPGEDPDEGGNAGEGTGDAPEPAVPAPA
jgi:molecular chaperone DnaK